MSGLLGSKRAWTSSRRSRARRNDKLARRRSVGARRDELALARDGVDDLDVLLLLEAGRVVGLGVAGDPHHPRGDLLVAHHGQAADDVALLPAHALDVEPV